MNSDGQSAANFSIKKPESVEDTRATVTDKASTHPHVTLNQKSDRKQLSEVQPPARTIAGGAGQKWTSACLRSIKGSGGPVSTTNASQKKRDQANNS